MKITLLETSSIIKGTQVQSFYRQYFNFGNHVNKVCPCRYNFDTTIQIFKNKLHGTLPIKIVKLMYKCCIPFCKDSYNR